MSNPQRPVLAAEARRVNQEQFARLGGEIRRSRKGRRLTQQRLGERVGLSQSAVSLAERGFGGSLSMDTWQRLFGAVDRRLVVDASRDPHQEPSDAGHLGIQELLLTLGRAVGYARTFELQTTPASTRHSVDVALRDDRRRLLLLLEAWNTFADIGAASRSTGRKVAEAEALALAIGGARPYRVASCWVIRATARNRALVARYPELFASRFPGSSVGWVRALTEGAEPPREPGLVWCDVAATRVYPWRRSDRAR